LDRGSADDKSRPTGHFGKTFSFVLSLEVRGFVRLRTVHVTLPLQLDYQSIEGESVRDVALKGKVIARPDQAGPVSSGELSTNAQRVLGAMSRRRFPPPDKTLVS
jgi:hypothetical protein